MKGNVTPGQLEQSILGERDVEMISLRSRCGRGLQGWTTFRKIMVVDKKKTPCNAGGMVHKLKGNLSQRGLKKKCPHTTARNAEGGLLFGFKRDLGNGDSSPRKAHFLINRHPRRGQKFKEIYKSVEEK